MSGQVRPRHRQGSVAELPGLERIARDVDPAVEDAARRAHETGRHHFDAIGRATNVETDFELSRRVLDGDDEGFRCRVDPCNKRFVAPGIPEAVLFESSNR